MFICVVQSLFVSIFQNYFAQVKEEHEKAKTQEKINKFMGSVGSINDEAAKEKLYVISLNQGKVI